jgi:hypothetical protein
VLAYLIDPIKNCLNTRDPLVVKKVLTFVINLLQHNQYLGGTVLSVMALISAAAFSFAELRTPSQ